MSEPIQIDWHERHPAPAGWRNGHAAVASISFDVDAETPLLAEGEKYATHLSTMSHQAYGPRVGVPRILELLERIGLRTTFFMPGATAERWPRAVEEILAAGQEIALHSYEHIQLIRLDADAQRADLERGLAALERFGVKPTGYRAPMWQQTRVTLDLLPQYGIRYDSSLMDDDRPYLVGPDRNLAELPVHWSLDDWEQYAYVPEPDIGHAIELPEKVLKLWTGELEAMRSTGSLCMICCHPFLTGRPSRLRNVERFAEFARELGDVELLPCGEIAERVLAG
ncbi:MAG TPA: polysaccharide deacetylase [Solirubrobacterales bacterium]|nr:polysaccharide deacetylase [Solirubrobacterales bacterium]